MNDSWIHIFRPWASPKNISLCSWGNKLHTSDQQTVLIPPFVSLCVQCVAVIWCIRVSSTTPVSTSALRTTSGSTGPSATAVTSTSVVRWCRPWGGRTTHTASSAASAGKETCLNVRPRGHFSVFYSSMCSQDPLVWSIKTENILLYDVFTFTVPTGSP